jgi:hypothetical protein
MNTGQRLARVQQDGHVSLNKIYAALALAVASAIMGRATPDTRGILRLAPHALAVILLDVGRLIDQTRNIEVFPAVTQSIRAARQVAEVGVEFLPVPIAVDIDLQGFRTTASALVTDRPSVLRQVGALVGLGIAQRLAASTVAKMVKEYFFKRDPSTGMIQVWPGRSNMGSQHARLVMLTETTRAHAKATLEVATRDLKLVQFRLSAGHSHADQCDGYSRGGPYTPGSAPMPPTHPRCKCWLEAIEPIPLRLSHV